VIGTQVLLQAASAAKVDRFIHVSTDEVYGSLGPEGRFTEDSPLAPNSPYAASKAASDLLVNAWRAAFGLDVIITRCSNNYGPYQFPEKLIPLMIVNAIGDKPLPIYGDGHQIRDWIYVLDHVDALLQIAEFGAPGETYNIGARNELMNLDLVKLILRILNKPESLIRRVEDRAGHDRRYAIAPAKLESQLGWKPRVAFEEGLRQTVQWYLGRRGWWESVMSGEYRDFYEKYYGERLRKAGA
jgi:dTDP-glucose 4,6-dehydratase